MHTGVLPGGSQTYSTHCPGAHTLQFHTRLSRFWDTVGHLIHSHLAHMAGLRAWTRLPTGHGPAHSYLQPLQAPTNECTPTQYLLCDIAQPSDGTCSRWLFLSAHSHPQDHPFSQAPKWFSRPLVLPGTLAAGRRARGLPRPPRSFAVAANSPHLGFIYSSHPLL